MGERPTRERIVRDRTEGEKAHLKGGADIFFFFYPYGRTVRRSEKNCVQKCSALNGEYFCTQKFFAPTYRSPDTGIARVLASYNLGEN